MGNEDPSLQYTGRTAHEVRLTRDFLIADREVSIEEYRRFLEDEEYPRMPSQKNVRHGPTMKWSVRHRNILSREFWDEAVLYCNWLSLREGSSRSMY